MLLKVILVNDELKEVGPESPETVDDDNPFKGDAMDAIYAHLWSLGNFQRMLSRRSVIAPAMAPESGAKPN